MYLYNKYGNIWSSIRISRERVDEVRLAMVVNPESGSGTKHTIIKEPMRNILSN
jgi:hypothetical protein